MFSTGTTILGLFKIISGHSLGAWYCIHKAGLACPQDVESLGRKLGYTLDNGNFHNVSLGQGQEVVAEEAMDTAATNGHWVVLQVRFSKKSSQNFDKSPEVKAFSRRLKLFCQNPGEVKSPTGQV